MKLKSLVHIQNRHKIRRADGPGKVCNKIDSQSTLIVEETDMFFFFKLKDYFISIKFGKICSLIKFRKLSCPRIGNYAFQNCIG